MNEKTKKTILIVIGCIIRLGILAAISIFLCKNIDYIKELWWGLRVSLIMVFLCFLFIFFG